MNDMNIILKFIFTFSFTFRAFGGQFYPKRPAIRHNIYQKKETRIHRSRYSKDVPGDECRALPAARVTPSPDTTEMAGMRG